MSFSLVSWLPWRRPPPPPVDVQAVAKEAAERAVRETVAEMTRALSPLLPVNANGASAPGIYARDRPWNFTVPQAPQRRPGSVVSLDTLRRVAETYDILRSCLEHLKREVAAVPREVVAKAQVPGAGKLKRLQLLTHAAPGQRAPAELNRAAQAEAKGLEEDPEVARLSRNIAAATAFLETPLNEPRGVGGERQNRILFESQIVEDLAVIGAAAVYYRPTRGGKPYALEAIDAATIRLRVDEHGWPGPGEAAYEQWVYGVPVAPYTSDELFFGGLGVRTHNPYPASPVEWLVSYVVNAALRTDQWNLAWLTDGTTPADWIALPEQWTADQFFAYTQNYRNQKKGDARNRQEVAFVPGGSQRVGNPSRKDQDFQEFSQELRTRCCALMGVHPAAIGFVGEQYAVTQENSMVSTSQFGAGALLMFLKWLYDDLLIRLGYVHLECKNVTSQDEDPKERAERNHVLVGAPTKTINEGRADEGLEPIEGGDEILVLNTMIPLSQALAAPQAPPGTSPNGAGSDGGTSDTTAADANPDAGFKLPGEADGATRAALALWEKKALRRLRTGEPAACSFVHPELTVEHAAEIERALGECDTPDAVRRLFREAQFEESKHPRQQGGKFASKGGEQAQEKAKPARDRLDPNKPRAGWHMGTADERATLGIGRTFATAHINEAPGAAIQAIAWRSNGKNKYFYSAAHKAARHAAKFERQRAFHEALPGLVSSIERDMQGTGKKADAAAVLYLQKMLGFRIGGKGETEVRDEEGNVTGTVETFGASSLLKGHVKVVGDTAHFNFPGKGNERQEHQSSDPQVVALVKERLDRSGAKLFATNAAGARDYLKEIDGDFIPHDFRTWNATAGARALVNAMPTPATQKELTAAVNSVADQIGVKLGDTRATVLDNYIDPAVFQEWRQAVGAA